jgi:RNA polymerase sigma factor (sigma-70 family)
MKATLYNINLEKMSDEEFIQNYINLIRKEVSKYTKNQDLKEDLVQDCLLKLLKIKNKIKEQNGKTTYILKTIKNTVKDRMKSKNSVYSNIVFNTKEQEKKYEPRREYDYDSLDYKNIDVNKEIFSLLSNTEIKIVRLLYTGHSQKTISIKLNVSESYISQAIKNIREKLNNNNIYY